MDCCLSIRFSLRNCLCGPPPCWRGREVLELTLESTKASAGRECDRGAIFAHGVFSRRLHLQNRLRRFSVPLRPWPGGKYDNTRPTTLICTRSLWLLHRSGELRAAIGEREPRAESCCNGRKLIFYVCTTYLPHSGRRRAAATTASGSELN